MDDVEKPKTVWHDVRKVCHDEAVEIASRLIAGAFGRDDKRPNFSIPCRPDHDDDCLILACIEQQKATAAIAAMEETHALVPKDPPQGLLVSMATCIDHGFGMPVFDQLSPMDHRTRGGKVSVARYQEMMLSDMRKCYDEVVGNGYWRPEKEAYYIAMLPTPPERAGSEG